MTTPTNHNLYLNGVVFDGTTAHFLNYTDVKIGSDTLAKKTYIDTAIAAVPAGAQGPAGAAGTNGTNGAA